MSTIFVTVGSTRFDRLIVKVLSTDFLDNARQLGFKRLIIQAGNSPIPDYVPNGMNIEVYTYKKNIMQDARKADLVISHGGAGTCLEMLRLNKKLLIVVNDSLMDNHQIELAEQLEKDRYAILATIETIEHRFNTIIDDNLSLKKFPKQTNKFGDILDEHLHRISI